MMRLLLIPILYFALASPVAAQPSAACEAPVLSAVATTGMIADVARNVGGNCVDVVQMMGPGIDPHLYRASESDVFKLLDAGVIFYGGLNLEARLSEIFEQMQAMGLKPTLAVGSAIPEALLLTETTYNQVDPHVWMDVDLWQYTIGAIRDELTRLDPARAETYAANAAAYASELEALDRYVTEQIARIPERQRVLVTAHDAFQYFGHAYDIEVFAPQGITTSSEAGVEDIRRTITLLVEREIPAVFVESSVPPDVVEAIIQGAAARGHAVRIGGELFSDAMGAFGTPEGTYIGMIRHNTDTIVSALLGGDAH